MNKYRKLVVNKEDFIPKGRYNPHNVRRHTVYNEYGIIGIVYASHTQEALDIMVDNGWLDSCQVSQEEYEENPEWYATLGNASEAFCLDYITVTSN